MASQNQHSVLEHRARRTWIALGWLLVFTVICLSVIPPPLLLTENQGDKFSHVLAYFALMSWFSNLYERPAQRTAQAVAFVLMGAALEFVQGWTGYRSFDLADMAANCWGVAAGWLLAPPRIPNYLRFVERICRIS